MKKTSRHSLVFLSLMTALASLPVAPAFASDHDDGELDLKGRALNLTDLYVFREDWQSGNKADSGNLVLVMNVNPRSLPQQAYYFSDRAKYEFHINRVAKNTDPVKTPDRDDITLSFRFDKPDSAGKQSFIMYGHTVKGDFSARDLWTTTLTNSIADTSSSLKVNEPKVGGSKVSVFAGLREDPFFFDVEKFFKLRAYALDVFKVASSDGKVKASVPAATFATTAANACDFAYGYNVNSIVVSIPISLLAAGTGDKSFDVWETVSISDRLARADGLDEGVKWTQIERLGRPAINEGLVVSNSLLNAFNSVPPSADLSSNATVVQVRTEAATTLAATYYAGNLVAGSPVTVAQANTVAGVVAGAFLPDVMRVDTSLSFNPGDTSYGGCFPTFPLCGGRKLTDDVVDITLSAIVGAGTGKLKSVPGVTTDLVSYDGMNTTCQGHHKLHGQSEASTDPAQFPFLAKPN